MLDRSRLDIFRSEEVEKRFGDICDNVIVSGQKNMNYLLAPEPVGCSSDGMESRVRFRMAEWAQNQRGQVHGGAVSGMMDTAMGTTIMAASGRNVTTASLSVNFIRPFIGESFVIDSEILKLGRNLIRVVAKAFDEENGKLLASASGDFAYVD